MKAQQPTFISRNGFSMIEVLITLLLISVGVLGMVAMQGRAIAYTQDSVQRNTAAMLAEDLMELLRANRDAVLDTDGVPRASSNYYKASNSDFPDPADECLPTPTSASEQLGCWAEKASAALPGAADLLSSEFHICRSASPGNCSAGGSVIEIRLAWSVKDGECLDASAGEDADPNVCSYTLRAEI